MCLLTRSILFIVFCLFIGASVTPIKAQTGPWGSPLKVSDNGHYLVEDSGKPVFLVGDTAWSLVGRLTRKEMNVYLAKRKAQGFNTVLFVLLWSASGQSNAYGDKALHETEGRSDPARPRVTPGRAPDDEAAYDYWDHVDYFMRRATEEGFYLAPLPCWGGAWLKSKASAFTKAKAYVYGQWLGSRFGHYRNLIWVLGGDVRPGDKLPEYRAMAEGLADGTNSVDQHDGVADYTTTLMTYHEPKVWNDVVDDFDTSATWFHKDPWLDQLAGSTQSAYWYNRRNGTWHANQDDYVTMTPAETGLPSGPGATDRSFNPPGQSGRGRDWVLVLKRTE